MAQRRIAIIAFLICCCFWVMPYCVQASSTADATAPIDVQQNCSLTLSYVYGGTAYGDVPVQVYQVATVSADYQYTLTEPFASSDLILNGIRTQGEWNVIRSTLEAYILAEDIRADDMLRTDTRGRVCFDDLAPGLYLVSAVMLQQGESHCFFDAALIALPGLNTEGIWQYQVEATMKASILPPVTPDETISLKVIKLWKGDEGRNSRPKQVEVEIFCNGSSYKTVILSEENHWSYQWSEAKDGATWTVVERNTPEGYRMTVEKRDTSFVLTNTFVPDNLEEPLDPPQTGDTSNILLYIILMIVSGSIFVIFGIVGKRNAHEDSK
ncbi:MAG: Cna B-type domain-containing protein [Clostridia bacterium]|nr:Cna B-type domain-containing protein [Clostridia bacterium]